jgi:proteic killer suppression protein
MILAFRHKGLQQFFETGTKRGIQPDQAPRLARILDRLDSSITPQDMNLPGYRLHELSGQNKGTWSVTVNGNWRVTFSFKDSDAFDVDYVDYH